MKKLIGSLSILLLLQSVAWAEGELGPPIPDEAPEETKPVVAEQEPQKPEEEKVLGVVYVTDNLILGMKDNPEGTGKNMKLLRSGARLEVLDRRGAFSKVRTTEGLVGWAKTTFMVKDKPSIILVDELKQENKSLQEQISQLKKGKNITSEKIVELKVDPQQKQRIVELELALDEARKQLSEQEDKMAVIQPVSESVTIEGFSAKQLLIALLSGMIAGGVFIFYYFRQRMRKRFAGLKV
jgi:SH3 domain protein